MIPVKVQEFLSSCVTNEWISVGNLEVYVRKSRRLDPRFHSPNYKRILCFDIANVSCTNKGRGEFTKFLKSLETLDKFGFNAVYIEQVLTDSFADYFRKLNCHEVQDLALTPSFFLFLG